MSSASFYGIDLDDTGPSAAPSDTTAERVWQFLRPKSSGVPLIRLGDDVDGSYLVPDDLEGISACFSPGANKIKHFEDVLTDRYGIKAHMCDFSCTSEDFVTPLRDGMQTFAKKWLDLERTEDNISLDAWVRQYDEPGDLLLQIDIEGAEYRNLLGTSDETLARFRIVVMELHGLGSLRDGAVLDQVLAPFFDKLGRHFTTVHAHPNNCCGDFEMPGSDNRIPHVLELTLVRHDHFVPGTAPVALPHPLDVSRNVPRRAPLFLSEDWSDHPRPLESRVKVLEDLLGYRDEVGAATAQDELAGVLRLTMQSVQTVARSVQDQGGARAATEVAHGRPFRLSSVHGPSARTGVVEPRGNYFFHTGFAANQSIRIDLGRQRQVTRIEVSNRLDGFQDRAAFLFVTLGRRNDPRPSVFPLHKDGSLPGRAWAECGIDVPLVTTRFVTISSPVNTALHFSDVRVFAIDGDPEPDGPAAGRSWPRRALASGYRRATRRARRRRDQPR